MLVTKAIIIAIALGVLLLAGCSVQRDPAATPAPESPIAIEIKTGIPAVDAFLALLEAADVDRIAAEAAFRDVACEADRGVQDHPLYCEEGEPDGTVKQAITTGCAPYFSAVTKDNLAGRLGWVQDRTRELETVYETDMTGVEYALIFVSEGAPPAPRYMRSVVYLTDDGRLASYASCGEFTETQGNTVQVWP